MSEVGDWCNFKPSEDTRHTPYVVNGCADQRLVTPVLSAVHSEDLLPRWGGTRKSIFCTVQTAARRHIDRSRDTLAVTLTRSQW